LTDEFELLHFVGLDGFSRSLPANRLSVFGSNLLLDDRLDFSLTGGWSVGCDPARLELSF